MKKLFSLLVAVGFTIGMTVSGAWGASVFSAPAAGIKLAAETAPKLAANNFDFLSTNAFESANIGSLIIYTPDISLNDGDKLTFELSNGLFMDNSYYLVDSTDGAAAWTSLGSVISTLDPVNGVASVTFRIENGPIPSATNLVLVNVLGTGGAAAPAATQAQATIEIRAASELSDGDKIQLRVTDAEDLGGTALPGANTVYADLIEMENQFAVAFVLAADAATSIIDVDNGRTQFEAVPLLDSLAEPTIDNDSDNSLDDYITVGAGHDFTLTLTCADQTGIDFTDATTTYWAGNANANAVALVSAGDEMSATVTGAVGWMPGVGTTDKNEVNISVDGTTILNTRTFTGQLVIDFGDPTSYNDLTFDLGTTHTWGINGFQAKIPYMLAMDSKHTVLRLVNQSNLAADVYVDMMGENAETATVEYTDGVPAKGSRFFTALQIKNDAAGWTGGDIYTATITMTVPNTQSLIEAYVWSTDGYRPATAYDTRSADGAGGTGVSK